MIASRINESSIVKAEPEPIDNFLKFNKHRIDWCSSVFDCGVLIISRSNHATSYHPNLDDLSREIETQNTDLATN